MCYLSKLFPKTGSVQRIPLKGENIPFPLKNAKENQKALICPWAEF
jgi:hypothetical protein